MSITENKLAADMSLARLVNAGSEQQIVPAPYVTWLQLGADSISSTALVTSNLNRLNLASAGAISLKDGAPLKGEPAGVADVELDLAPPSMGTGRSGGMRAEELNTSEQ